MIAPSDPSSPNKARSSARGPAARPEDPNDSDSSDSFQNARAKESRRSAKIGKNKGKTEEPLLNQHSQLQVRLQPAVGRRGPCHCRWTCSACPARRPASTETPSGGAGTSHTTMGTSTDRASRRAPLQLLSQCNIRTSIQPRPGRRWSPARRVGQALRQPKEELVTGHEGPWWELHQRVPEDYTGQAAVPGELSRHVSQTDWNRGGIPVPKYEEEEEEEGGLSAQQCRTRHPVAR